MGLGISVLQPDPSDQSGLLINRGLDGANGTTALLHRLLQAFNGLR